MIDRTIGSDLVSVLMEIAQNPALQRDLDKILGDFCHQCRNRLNSLKLSLYLAKRQSPNRVTETWRDLESDYQALERQFERVQTICRPMCPSFVTIDLSLLFEDRRLNWSKILTDQGLELEFVRPQGRCLARFDVNQMGAALDAVIQWRAEQGSLATRTLLKWWDDSGRTHVEWVEAASIVRREKTPSPPRPEVAWTLPNLAQVVAEHGGTIKVDERNGWVLSFSWPSPSI